MVKRRDILIILIVFFLDVITKIFVKNFVFIEGIFQFKVAYNTGISFSLFQGLTWVPLLLNILTFLAIVFFWIKEDLPFFPIVIGGALGNLLERIFFGHVTDFLSFGSFAIFNIADTAICIGIGLTILQEFRKKKK